MSVILVVQPDHAQAKVLHDVVHRIGAELVIVDSTARAIEAIGRQTPDLILLSVLLSPREEDTLMARLRSLEGASHLQTLTLPQFRASEAKRSKKSGFGFRKKQKAPVEVGADPAAFAEEIAAQLARAHEIRSRPAPAEPVRSVLAAPVEHVAPLAVADDEIESVAEMDSIWAAPAAEAEAIAEMEPVAETEPVAEAEPIEAAPFDSDSEEIPEPIIEALAAAVEAAAMEESESAVRPTAIEPPEIEALAVSTPAEVPAPAAAATDEDEIDRLVRQLGLDVRLVEIEEVAPAESESMPVAETEDVFDFGAALDRARIEADARRAAEMAQLQADAEVIRASAIAEARAAAEREAREALAADLARVQAEAEAMREIAIAEARAVAEREARETMNAELARVRSETEVTVADALNKVKVEAEEAERIRVEAERMRVEAQEAFAAELARVRAEVEQSLTVQLDAARAEAERMRTAEAAAVRERAAAEAQLKTELDRLRFVAAQVRKADESETRKAADQIKQLEGELERVRAKAEERQVAELEEIKVQMAEMREAAARHVRDAAAEAVAAEVARATAHAAATPVPRPTAVIAQFPTREAARIDPEQQALERTGYDYLSLWQPHAEAAPVEDVPTNEVEEEPEPEEEEDEERVSFRPDLRRHAKWALPIAACLLLVASTGTAISSFARFVKPAEPPPALTVEPVEIEPFIQVVEKRVGRLLVESTPSGAEAVVDGRSYGRTPVNIPGLEVGSHTLVLRSSAGTITRKVAIKANETTQLSEAIFSGWIAIFSPIPVTAVIDGKPVNLTEDGRFMTTPGKHVVELISERFNYRATQTLDVRPGETAAHTLSVPMGSVRVSAPDGAEIRVDGQPASGVPAEGLAIAIGSHEISATHPERGERRVAVDVRHGAQTDVTLPFD